MYYLLLEPVISRTVKQIMCVGFCKCVANSFIAFSGKFILKKNSFW